MIALIVKQNKYEGWKEIKVTKSISQLAGAFHFSTTEREDDIYAWEIRMGDECQVTINDQLVITGYIDEINKSYDGSSHSIEVIGRDKVADLVDCCCIDQDDPTKNIWMDQKVKRLIKTLCDPFDIDLVIDGSVASDVERKVDGSFKINEGDTVFDSILRLCGKVAVLPVSIGDGKLLLTRAGSDKAYDSLELGKNIKSGSALLSDVDRFSKYIVKATDSGEDDFDISYATETKGEAVDSVMAARRYRPTVILLNGKAKNNDADKRARWERNTRAGHSRQYNYQIQGLVQSNGDVWRINQLLKVKDSKLGVDKELLISELGFSAGEEGSNVDMTVMDKNSFDILEVDITSDMDIF